ncbi:MAG TPA: class I SAM-dependent methyltransferase [Candidatus Eisenbacteria bacterium]|nr:class I SAM-dependent methyltransferase [Candidatus Eisenbacteria bacterium]
MRHIQSRKITACRMCGSTQLVTAIDLGKSPLANAYVQKGNLKKKEKFYPLTVLFCKKCTLVQLSHVVNAQTLFQNYLYVSSTSPVFVEHFKEFAKDAKKRLRLKKGDLIVDIGSNDGILLKPFLTYHMRVLGIDPAKNIAPIARKNGVDTLVAFFSPRVARNIVKKYGKAQLITATNAFAHIDNHTQLLEAVNILLEENGTYIIEAPYMIDFIQKKLFDLIYHEHLSYISLAPLVPFVQKFGMRVVDAERVNSHGGSIRIFIQKESTTTPISPRITQLLELEKQLKLGKISTYKQFAKDIEKNKKDLLLLLARLKRNGKHIAGYGAPAKGNTLLNYFGITRDMVEYIIDDSPLKQGLFTPGTHIPIISHEQSEKENTDYLLILAWNFADSIMKRLSQFKKSGGKFIIPVPHPKII